MGDITNNNRRQASMRSRRLSYTQPPLREDCWSEEATDTLIDAWGDRCLQFNKGNLRQKHWQEVADAVNERHGYTKKARRTDIQCKNRIDTVKKKYKVEKARVSESDGKYVSPWPFFGRLDALIGNLYQSKKISSVKTPALPYRRKTPRFSLKTPIPVAPRSATVRRAPPAEPMSVDSMWLRRNFSALATIAAAAAATDESEPSSSNFSAERSEDEECCKGLAQAIDRFGDIYERVEQAKQRQMVELEKQRMQFVMDLEIQRMKFVETQLQLEKIKRTKRSDGADTGIYSWIALMENVL